MKSAETVCGETCVFQGLQSSAGVTVPLILKQATLLLERCCVATSVTGFMPDIQSHVLNFGSATDARYSWCVVSAIVSIVL